MKLNHRICRILLTDFTYVLFAVIYGIGSSVLRTTNARYDIPRAHQVWWHTVSMQFDPTVSPDVGYSWAAFILIGITKMLYSMYYWKTNKLRFVIEQVEGWSSFWLPIINSSINYDVHVAISAVLAISAAVMYLVRYPEKKLKEPFDSIFSFTIICTLSVLMAELLSFTTHQSSFGCKWPDEMECAAISLSPGYTEIFSIVILFSLDWLSCSELFMITAERFGCVEKSRRAHYVAISYV